MEPITWTTEKRKLGDLQEWDKNPRQLSKHDANELGKSIGKFNLADPLIINTDNQIVGGHQRKRVMLDNGYSPDSLIDVRVPSRELTDEEAAELNVRLNRNAGEWDFDILANEFELNDLLEWGFTEADLGVDSKSEVHKTTLLDQAIQLEPSKEYVVIMCEDAEDFEQLKVVLNLQPVRRGGYRPGSMFDAIGTQRVIFASTLLELLDANRDSE